MPEAIGTKPHRELQRRLKRGYRLVQSQSGRYHIENGEGVTAKVDGHVITLPANPRGEQFNRQTMHSLELAGVLRPPEQKHRKSNGGSSKRAQTARAMATEREKAHAAEAKELLRRLKTAVEPVGGMEQPGMLADITVIASMLARENGSRLTPDLLGPSLSRVVREQWVTGDYQDVWEQLIEQLEQGGSVDTFFLLLRRAKGLPTDVFAEQLQIQEGDWPFRNELVPLEQLLVDHEYQRPVPWPFVRKMALNFDSILVGNLDVSERARGATFAIMDGQCRFEAMRRVGKTTAWCSVYSGLDKAAEAGFFLRKNRDRKAVNPYWTFRAQVTSGDMGAIEMERTVSRNGYRIASNSGGGHDDRNLTAISALREVHFKRETLEPTLKALRGGFGLEGGQTAGLIRGLGQFFQVLPDAEVERTKGLI